MIKLIGLKRALLLGAILSINLLIAAFYLLGVMPLRDDADASLTAVNGRISKTSSDIQNVKTVLANYTRDYAQYQALGSRGFFDPQDRFQAGHTLDALRTRANLLGYAYKLDSIKTIPNTDADAGNLSLIDTRITLEKISSTLDTNMYALIDSFATDFPQQARIANFSLKRIRDPDEASLKNIAKSSVAFVEGAMAVDWLTVVPKTAAATDKPGQPGGFRGR